MEITKMTDEQIEDIVKYLPEEQREEARYRIRRAHLDGVTDIGLCTGDEPPDISDLAGNCPRKLAEYLARGDEWSSGFFIGFNKYASGQ